MCYLLKNVNFLKQKYEIHQYQQEYWYLTYSATVENCTMYSVRVHLNSNFRFCIADCGSLLQFQEFLERETKALPKVSPYTQKFQDSS